MPSFLFINIVNISHVFFFVKNITQMTHDYVAYAHAYFLLYFCTILK